MLHDSELYKFTIDTERLPDLILPMKHTVQFLTALKTRLAVQSAGRTWDRKVTYDQRALGRLGVVEPQSQEEEHRVDRQPEAEQSDLH